MWRNTRSCARSLAFALALAVVTTAAPAQAQRGPPPLPASAVALAPGLSVQGGGEFTFYGISVYDAWYWSPVRGWPNDGPFVLDLIYHRDLDGAAIAKKSVEEITKLGYGTSVQRAHWGDRMNAVFPNVKKGDRLTGVYLRAGAVRYFHNGTPIGEIDEAGFALAFFGIWLDPKTSRSDFRQKLLGQQ